MRKLIDTKAKIAIALITIGVIATSAVLSSTIIMHNRNARQYTNEALEAKITEDLNYYLQDYQLSTEETKVLDDIELTKLTSDIASITTGELTKKEPDVQEFSRKVSNTVNKAGSGLNPEQLEVITTGIEAVCITDTYNTIASRGLVDTATLNILQSELDKKIQTLDNNIGKQSEEYDQKIKSLEAKIADTNISDANQFVTISNSITAITNQLRSVASNTESKEQIDAIKSSLNSVLEDLTTIHDGNEKTTETLKAAIEKLEKNSLTAKDLQDVELALSTVNADLTKKIVEQSKAVEDVSNDLQSLVDDCETQKVATQNAITNTKSLIDKDLITLENTIDANKKDLNSSIDDLEDVLNNQINTQITTMDGKLKTVSDKLDNQNDTLQGLIDTAQNDYDTYLSGIQSAEEAARSNIGSDKDSAIAKIETDRASALLDIATSLGTKETSGALFDIETDKNAALGEIASKEAASKDAIKADADTAKSELNTAATKAQSDLNTAVTNAQDSIDATIDEVEQMKDEIEDMKSSFITGTYSTDAYGNPVIIFRGGQAE